MTPDNTIIIPTLGNLDGLKKSVESIQISTDLSRTDVIVVANGSPREAVEFLESLGEPFSYVFCPEPIGFPNAINVGAMIATGKRLILYNDDAIILDWGYDDEWVRTLEKPFEDERMAVTGTNRDFWSWGKFFLVFFCVMIDRNKFFELGMLDEVFSPGCGEDADFCLKAQERGYLIKQVPVESNNMMDTSFPVWHIGHKTCETIPNFDTEVGPRNTAILEERWPRSEEERQFQKDYFTGVGK